MARNFRIAQCCVLRNTFAMTLDQYLIAAGRTGSDFATAVGLTEASVSRIRNGQQNITRDVMRRIINASGGQVTADGLVGPVVEPVA